MFTAEQLAQLNSPLDSSRIKTRAESGKTYSYLDGEDVIRTANRIFGFGQWSSEALEVMQTSQQFVAIGYRDGRRSVRPIGGLDQLGEGEKAGYTVGWMARVQVTLMSGARFTDVGHGDGTNMPSLAGANEFAVKEAVTDAVKRCLRFMGDQFGLTLWDKDQEHVGDGPADEATRKKYIVAMQRFEMDEEHAMVEVTQTGIPWAAATADDLKQAYSRISSVAPATSKATKAPDEFKEVPKDDPEDQPPPDEKVREDQPMLATTQDLNDLAAVVKAKGVKNFRAIVEAESKEHGGVLLSWLKEQLAELSKMDNV